LVETPIRATHSVCNTINYLNIHHPEVPIAGLSHSADFFHQGTITLSGIGEIPVFHASTETSLCGLYLAHQMLNPKLS